MLTLGIPPKTGSASSKNRLPTTNCTNLRRFGTKDLERRVGRWRHVDGCKILRQGVGSFCPLGKCNSRQKETVSFVWTFELCQVVGAHHVEVCIEHVGARQIELFDFLMV